MPPTMASKTAVFPCMTMYNNKYFDTKGMNTQCLFVWDHPSRLWVSIKNPKISFINFFRSFCCVTFDFGNLLDNASRVCLASGAWSPLTDYSACAELCIEVDQLNQTTQYIDCELLGQDQGADTEISVHVYFVGNTYIEGLD